MVKGVSFGVLLAPYRVDYYNYLHDKYNFDIYFQLEMFSGQMFSSYQVENSSTYKPVYLKIKKLPGDRQIAIGLYHILKERNPGIVIVPEFSILTVQVILLKLFFGFKYKIISQCDDSINMLNCRRTFSKVHGLSRRLCMPFIDDLILVDRKAVEWYQERYKRGVWIPIIKDESKLEFYPKEVIKKADSIRADLKLEGKLTLLFVARHIAVKNLPILFKACKNLDRPYHLLVLGDGEERASWEQIAEEMDVEVSFVGQQNGVDLQGYYYASDIFVLPSIIEPFGAVTNEALLYGCVCVISEMAGSASLICEGVNGYLFNPFSEDDLAEKILLSADLLGKTPKSSLMQVKFRDVMCDLEKIF